MTLLFVLLACSASRVDWVQRFDLDAEGTMARVAELPPLEQEAVVLNLVESRPGQTARLCGTLQDPGVRARCDRMNSRPHLWTLSMVPPVAPVRAQGSARGPRSEDLVFSAAELDRWALVPADPGRCQPATPRYSLCLSDDARAATLDRAPQVAAARCRAQPTALLAADCFFASAELVDQTRDTRAALDLCLGAGTLAAECTAHVLQALALVDEGALKGGEPDVGRMVAVADAIGPGDVQDLWWAIATWTWVVLDPVIQNEPRPDMFWDPEIPIPDGLPPLARAHLWDALSWWQRSRVLPEQLGTSGRAPRGGAQGTWIQDLPGEEAIPSGFFLGLHGGRRPHSDDPTVDLELATLTASLAYLHFPAELARGEMVLQTDRLVRWTGLRLLKARVPDHPAVKAALQDEDPLLRSRAAF